MFFVAKEKKSYPLKKEKTSATQSISVFTKELEGTFALGVPVRSIRACTRSGCRGYDTCLGLQMGCGRGCLSGVYLAWYTFYAETP
jgi:hypothetical protein